MSLPKDLPGQIKSAWEHGSKRDVLVNLAKHIEELEANLAAQKSPPVAVETEPKPKAKRWPQSE